MVAPVCEQIASKTCTAAQAVDEQFRALEELMRGAPDPYMQQRAGDFSDLREQLLRVLLNCPKPDISSLQADVILVAQQLTPSDTIRMDFAHIAGILCADGSRDLLTVQFWHVRWGFRQSLAARSLWSV